MFLLVDPGRWFHPVSSPSDGGWRQSAYSVFNDGYESLLGDLRMDQVEAELRGDRMLRGYQQQQQQNR